MLTMHSFAPGMFLPAVLDVAISTLYLCRLKRLRHETLVELPFESDDRLSRRIFARLMRIALLCVRRRLACLMDQDQFADGDPGACDGDRLAGVLPGWTPALPHRGARLRHLAIRQLVHGPRRQARVRPCREGALR